MMSSVRGPQPSLNTSFQHRNEAVDHDVGVTVTDIERIEAHDLSARCLGWVDDDHVVDALLGDGSLDDVSDEFPLGVDHQDRTSGGDVGRNEVEQHRRLPDPSRTERQQVLGDV